MAGCAAHSAVAVTEKETSPKNMKGLMAAGQQLLDLARYDYESPAEQCAV